MSTVKDQKAMFYRASAENAVLMLNAQLRAIAPEEAWHEDNIRDASDEGLNQLRESISQCLVDTQRKLGITAPLKGEVAA